MTSQSIWLVDDTESNRRLYSDILRHAGYAVDTFEGGPETIARAECETPDLVVLDVRMPDMDGFEVCRALSARWRDDFVPILMLTAIDDHASYVRGLESGAHDYLTQPVEIERLQVRVRSLLRLRKAHLELRSARRRLAERVDDLSGEVARRERQLVLADRLAAIGQMAAAIAHEINNPLTYVSANANFCRSVMAERGDTDSDWHAAMDAVITGIERIRDVIHDVQTFSHAPATDGRADVRQVIESASSMARHAFRHCAELGREIQPVPLWAAMPQSQLAQVLLNLLVNAAHACEDAGQDRGRIQVTARRDGARVVIEVTDSGTGISADRLDDIFEPFFTSKSEGRGTGLGLPICRDFLERAGGAIEVTSTVGAGSTFRVTVPAASPPQPIAGARRARRISVHPERIVIIDDEPLVAFALARMLPGYHVRTFVSVDEALPEAVAADVILCDLMMPDKGGIKLYEELPEPARRRILFVSGGAYRDREREFLESIPNAHLDKPIRKEELRAAIGKLLAETTQ